MIVTPETRYGVRRRAVGRISTSMPVDSPIWREQVRHRLLDGYGAEDIALWLDCYLSRVRAEVVRLREAGEFGKWWGQE